MMDFSSFALEEKFAKFVNTLDRHSQLINMDLLHAIDFVRYQATLFFEICWFDQINYNTIMLNRAMKNGKKNLQVKQNTWQVRPRAGSRTDSKS